MSFFLRRGQRLCLLTVALLLFAMQVCFAESPPPASVENMLAESAILINARTGESLYERNADEFSYPASTTKMMTCILALESGRLDEMVTIVPSDADVESTRMVPGEQATLRSLTAQMMMISDNGAALAIGRTLGGSTAGFAKMMNAKVKELGLRHTHFMNPNGMPNDYHYSTARDLSAIAAYGMKNPAFREIVGSKRRTIYYHAPAGHTEECGNSNELLYRYPGCTGVKTGWTNAAAGCLVASAKRGNTELIAVVLHSRTDDTRFSDAAALLDYGFSYFKNGSRDEG